MAAIDLFPSASIWSGIRDAFRSARRPQTAAEDDDGARRRFILEMIDECPEAIASEEGLRGAMYYFSGRF